MYGHSINTELRLLKHYTKHNKVMNNVGNKTINAFLYPYSKHYWNRNIRHIHQLLMIIHQSERKYMLLLLFSKFNMAIAASF